VVAEPFEFGAERVDIFDSVEVAVFVLEVPEEAFDPCLVGRGVGSAVVGGEPVQEHELSG